MLVTSHLSDETLGQPCPSYRRAWRLDSSRFEQRSSLVRKGKASSRGRGAAGDMVIYVDGIFEIISFIRLALNAELIARQALQSDALLWIMLL